MQPFGVLIFFGIITTFADAQEGLAQTTKASSSPAVPTLQAPLGLVSVEGPQLNFPRSPAGANLTAEGGVRVLSRPFVNWIVSTPQHKDIPVTPGGATIIFADELDLGEKAYVYPAGQNPQDIIIFAYRVNLSKPVQFFAWEDTYGMETNTDRFGFDYQDFPVKDGRECLNACRVDENCRAYTYRSSPGHCWLKNPAPPPTSRPGFHSGSKLTTDEMIKDPLHHNRPGGNYNEFGVSPGPNGVYSPAPCFEACQNDSQCRALSYWKTNLLCYLKRIIPGIISAPHFFSAVKSFRSDYAFAFHPFPVGRLTLVAQRLTCENNGQLTYHTFAGGDFQLFVEQMGEMPGGATTALTCLSLGKEGPVTGVTSPRLADSFARIPNGDRVASQWLLAMLDQVSRQIADAAAANNAGEVSRLFRKSLLLRDKSRYPLHHDDGPGYDAIVDKLDAQRQQLLKPLWVRETWVDRGGLQQKVTLATEEADLDTYLMPTQTVARPVQTPKGPKLGTILFDPAHPEEVQLMVDADLTVDAYLAEQVRRMLRKQGEQYSGVFQKWTLSQPQIQDVGIVKSEVTVADSLLQLRLTVEQRRLTLIVEKLLRSGLPLQFTWQYPGVEPGTIRIPFSLAYRAPHEVEVSGLTANNRGKITVGVEYAQLTDHDFQFFQPAIGVAGEQTVSLPLSQGAAITLPSTAVNYYGAEAKQWQTLFQVGEAEDAVETVRIRNEIPATDPQRRDSLRHLSHLHLYVKVVHEKDGEKQEFTRDYPVQPADLPGSDLAIPFLRPPGVTRTIFLTGIAYFQGGSQQTLLPLETRDASIHLTTEQLGAVF